MSSHVDAQGNVMMVDISGKATTIRAAEADGFISMSDEALQSVRERRAAKGDVLTVAQLAGIMGAKRASDLIPLCHPLPLENCKVDLAIEAGGIRALCRVKTEGRTGVEMEALTGVSVALLAVYDMCKSLDKGMEISSIRLLKKTGGKSGVYARPGAIPQTLQA
ncbi:MAG: cyclic pyranopterin monophosphate synthase MoaC [Desulfovibrio sp.]|jgi:cyclic pyranopterin phosphate synthase|nr:cyclic pyranopterin monophosphate synthase MoaC [Desulfovibrio sp.]